MFFRRAGNILKFSIGSICLAMVIMALLLGVMRSRRELIWTYAKEAQTLVETATIGAETARLNVWRDLSGTQQARLRQDASELAQLSNLLEEAFARHRESLSQLDVEEGKISIRSVPVLETPNVMQHETKVFIPRNRSVFVQASQTEQAARLEDLKPSADIQGPDTIRFALEPGEHLVAIRYDDRARYEDQENESFFTLTIDGAEVARWTLVRKDSNGYSVSTTSWNASTVLSEDRPLPRLLKFTPIDTQVSIQVELDGEAPSDD